MSRSAHHETIGGSLRPRGPIHVALTARHDAHETVVSVAGELDILTVPRLASTLDDIVRRHQGDVVMDLTRTEFIDSLGLHALLNVQRRLAERSRRFTVICGEGAVRHAIELARLTGAFGVISSFAEYSLHRAAGDPTPTRVRPPRPPA
jgi:anti-sigma B factor antagonist